MSLSLIVDTSVFGVGMALIDQNKSQIVWKKTIAKKFASASHLSHLWAESQEDTGVDGKDIQRILISSGPGSFTGIKVGLSWAYGFSAAQPEMLWSAVSSFALSAFSIAKVFKSQSLVLMMPITKTHGFLSKFTQDGEESKNHLISTDEIDESKRLVSGANIFMVGEWAGLEQKLAQMGLTYKSISFAEVLEFGMEGMIDEVLQKKVSWSPSLPKPNYMRKSSAEENLNKKLKELS